MLLKSAHVTLFKSIDDSTVVSIDPEVTVLVGQNESGKTAFLQALYKSVSVEEGVKFDKIQDYPRKWVSDYESRHKYEQAKVVYLEYELSDKEIDAINNDLGYKFLSKKMFGVEHYYGNTRLVSFHNIEKPYVDHLVSQAPLPSEIKTKAKQSTTIRQLIDLLLDADLNAEAQTYLENLQTKFEAQNLNNWTLLNYYIWKKHLDPNIPQFLYFDEYKLLPGKVNLTRLQKRFKEYEDNGTELSDEDRTVLSLLKLAKIELKTLMSPGGYETSRAQLEGISNSTTDKIFRYWRTNQNLEVQFDVKSDPQDQPPFNDGPNLYIRIRNLRHRVSVPFDQRSRGFIWFFSFLVWFDSIKQSLDVDRDLILLLDEPGLNLHATAQNDLLKYIDDLSKNHQVIYSTHSPFMVQGERLHQVRTVEDRIEGGTIVSDNVSNGDPKTLFPLQAALGYTIAQNLFISPRNLLVEGPADLVYLKFFSNALDQIGKSGLREDVTVVPVGGLDKLATFVALLRGNDLEIVVLHDFIGQSDRRLESLVQDKLIRDKNIMHYGMFRNNPISNSGGKKAGQVNLPSSDVEDLISTKIYLQLFNDAFKNDLGGINISETDLPPGDRIIDRLNRYLSSNSILLKPKGGFNHYRVANHLASNPLKPKQVDKATLDRFEQMFNDINNLFNK